MVIINKGKVAVEGEVEKLLNTDDMKVTLEVNNINDALQLINNSEFATNYRDHAGNRIMLQMKKEQMASLNRKLIENNIDVIAMIPMRSLEEYFLNLT